MQQIRFFLTLHEPPNSTQVLGGVVGENEGKCVGASVGDFVGNFVGEDEEDDLSTCAKVGFFVGKGVGGVWVG